MPSPDLIGQGRPYMDVKISGIGRPNKKVNMKYDPEKHHRRSIRLKGYDYSQAGFYFVTIVTHNRACLFGEIVDGAMHLNKAGKIARQEWLLLAKRFNVRLDAFVVMPNHIHAILVILDREIKPTQAGATLVFRQNLSASSAALPTITSYDAGGSPLHRPAGPAPGSLGAIIGQFKSRVTKRLGCPVWHRGYYEHIIRDDDSLDRIRMYIEANPINWAIDKENPCRGNPPM
jgi:REP element-mobilizing transposase RayT